MGDSYYNGYSPAERDKKYKELLRRIRKGEQPSATGPCMLCGDPDVPVEYHDEDYSEPYLWEPPALLCLCRNCHRNKLHKRFSQPSMWRAFVAHVRRGGYARDILAAPKGDPTIRKEFAACKAAIEAGEPYEMRPLRPYTREAGTEWFDDLRMDIESLDDPSSRPRP